MLELRALGHPRVVLTGDPVTEFVSDKAQALLFYLSLIEGPQSRRKVAGLLWGEMPDRRARANLRVTLHNVRKLFPGYIEVTRKEVAFVRDRPHWVDVTAFLDCAKNGADLDTMEKAAALYQNDFLGGLNLRDASGFEIWLMAERERLRLSLANLLEKLVNLYEERNQWRNAESAARRLLAVEPLREQTQRQLMLLLARQGRYTAAMVQYDEIRGRLAEELNLAPMPVTKRLYERIRKLRSGPIHNLPSPPSLFIGRKEELQSLRELTEDKSHRLLTLTGLGGVGKTRLALALGKSVRDRFIDGIFYVGVADVRAKKDLSYYIAESMGITLTECRSFPEQLIEDLQERELLIIVDNLEERPEDISLLQQLTTELPTVKVIAVSRRALNLPSACKYPVPGMSLPHPGEEDLLEADAVQLFLRQARQKRREFSPSLSELKAIAEICRLVDGNPLAIEQAASWLRILSPHQLMRELERDIFSITRAPQIRQRHRSMEAVLEQSWRRLGVTEREGCKSLVVFRREFSLEAAITVSAVPARVLARLIDHSMLNFNEGSGNYWMPTLLRRFVAGKLAS